MTFIFRNWIIFWDIPKQNRGQTKRDVGTSIQVPFLNALPNIGKKFKKTKYLVIEKQSRHVKIKREKAAQIIPLTIVLLIFSFKLLYCPNLQLITVYDTLLFNSIFFCYPSSYFLLLFLGFFFHRNDGGLKFYTLYYYYYFIIIIFIWKR